MAPKDKSAGGSGAPKDEGKYFELPGAVEGEVVVRFPPEASGYLHIGHAKAALLNAHYQRLYRGKLIFRFDDTNPEKEKESFEKIIEGDVALLEIVPDHRSYTSDHFELMLRKAEEMIATGRAYVDDTPAEQMKQEREQKIESVNRGNSIERNLEIWREMVAGSEIGQRYCLRAKIDMQSDNGCMRDPTIYRCKLQEHPRTGFRFKAYPTYDFACPIVDSVEGVTHALRTTEYMDRDAQFAWFCDALEIRTPAIASYSRLNLMNTVLSKRKLTFFVQEGIVDGWDDPRMPTVRGVLRRGLTVEGLKQFIASQGSSKSVVVMDWDKIWSFNRKVIDPLAGRYSAVETANAVSVRISDPISAEQSNLIVPLHPKNTDLGTRTIKISQRLLIDQADAQLMTPGATVTFINLGNLKIIEIEHDQQQQDKSLVTGIVASLDLGNKDFKKTLKVTWLAAADDAENADPRDASLIYYDHIIRKPVLGRDDDFKQFINRNSKLVIAAKIDSAVCELPRGSIIQIQRKGFFIVDVPHDEGSRAERSPIELISIPDGSTDLNIFPAAVREWRKANAYVEEPGTKAAKTSPVCSGEDTSKISSEIAQLNEKLAELMIRFKRATGKEWSPVTPTPTTAAATPTNAGADSLIVDLDQQIRKQGDLIRKLKAEKAGAEVVKPAVEKLLALKTEFRKMANVEWKPEYQPPKSATPLGDSAQSRLSCMITELDAQIRRQGTAIRELKAGKAGAEVVKPAVEKLLALKAEFRKIANGVEWTPDYKVPTESTAAAAAAIPAPATTANPVSAASQAKSKNTKESSAKKSAKSNESNKSSSQSGDGGKLAAARKQTRLGIETAKSVNYSEWYTEVITKAEMIEYYDVSGCYILRPWSYSIWESIQAFFDAKIKSIGVVNCYFPMFISKAALETEKTHIADFAPEVAWVTKSGQSDLAEPIAIRPTSETVMYPSYAKWVQSHRDLPIQLNQWCNVVRWEFKQPTPFLRTREFLWQEGHSAFATAEETLGEVYQILEFYAQIYEQLLAIPVVRGRKTEKEKFAGGDMTTTIEAYVDVNGRGIQGATSHFLGQNFSKMFDLSFEDPDRPGEKRFAYQTSWGLSTRTIGAMIMIHGDDRGLVLPPRVAAIHVAIVPCGITAGTGPEERARLIAACHAVAGELRAAEYHGAPIRVRVDDRDQYSPGWKFNHWELKGVPIRAEIGPKDLARGELVAVRRDNGEKISISRSDAIERIRGLLDTIQQSLYDRALAIRDERTAVVDGPWTEFTAQLDRKCIILSPFCGEPECEEAIRRDSTRDDDNSAAGPLMGAKSLCVPLQQPKEIAPEGAARCIHPACERKPKFYTLFGRSY